MSTASLVTERVIFLALELSRSTWLAALRRPGAEKAILHRLDGGDTTGLLAFIAAQRTRAEARLGAPVEVISCFEAGRDGFWLHRLLLAHGVASHIVEPTSILVSRRAPPGTDRLDAEGLLRVLMACHRGDRQVCSVLRVPSPEEEDGPGARIASAITRVAGAGPDREPDREPLVHPRHPGAAVAAPMGARLGRAPHRRWTRPAFLRAGLDRLAPPARADAGADPRG